MFCSKQFLLRWGAITILLDVMQVFVPAVAVIAVRVPSIGLNYTITHGICLAHTEKWERARWARAELNGLARIKLSSFWSSYQYLATVSIQLVHITSKCCTAPSWAHCTTLSASIITQDPLPNCILSKCKFVPPNAQSQNGMLRLWNQIFICIGSQRCGI